MGVMHEAECWLRGWFDHLERDGLVRRIETCMVPEHDRLRVSFVLRDGRERCHEISHSEIAMGGIPELRHWAETVERDLRHEVDPRRPSPLQAPPWRSGTATEMRLRQAEAEHHMSLHQRLVMERLRIDHSAWLGMDFATPQRDEKAEKRAADLFKMTAGEVAFRTLEAGSALPIKGSNGTKYRLYKRASFCVERVSDGARLCAVVPNVPLWDHLLGIKLMVENDELKFLETANVAGGVNPYLDAAIYGRSIVNFRQWA